MRKQFKNGLIIIFSLFITGCLNHQKYTGTINKLGGEIIEEIAVEETFDTLVEEAPKSDILPFGEFHKYDKNPILFSSGTGFESMAVFNPTAILKDEIIYMFYRAENWGSENWPDQSIRPKGWKADKEWPGVSTIGLATSKDGINFIKKKEPVIAPEFDYEIIGGCEDPRISKVNGLYYMTYTGMGLPNRVGKMCIATSKDLINWKKHGPIFDWEENCKAGVIIPEIVNGKYWMYFGDKNIWLASSVDGINWMCDKETDVLFSPREGKFDSLLCEPGPTPVITEKGIVLIYNGATKGDRYNRRMTNYGDPAVLGASKLREYSTGWALFSKEDPSKLIARSDKPFLEISEDFEKRGQVDNVLFTSGLIEKDNKWYMYYGCADTYIGVAISEGVE